MAKLLRVGITLLVVAVAIVAGSWVWNYYLYSPWTRDGRIRAEVITVAPDVSGWVTQFNVENHQAVSQGELLFTIDDTRYKAALAEAEAKVAQERSAWELATHQYQRRQGLSDSPAISEEDQVTYRINMESAKASYELARAALATARIDLERTQVVAPEDGTISNLHLRQGNYVTQGAAVLSLVKDDSFYVTGYFEETKLQLVHVGQSARMTLMGGGRELTGEVVSIARGIADTNTSSNEQMLPQVQQTFNWVRLAQRIPVDIRLDSVPEDIHLSAGMTVSIYLDAE
ncbi:HlyD family secretion protein [Marinobacter sediminum]|uniref:efflux RND transporter periplasmic adaptor subunit n=1 Tax=Marinobacter sediminum TaxID=256323 RepID=UPI00202E3AA5|nr:HlyD family secretion protein [Marinobacter sediminum]MCM0612961.1 HlyD family secretion protein [Marinobacter sediminum]